MSLFFQGKLLASFLSGDVWGASSNFDDVCNDVCNEV